MFFKKVVGLWKLHWTGLLLFISLQRIPDFCCEKSSKPPWFFKGQGFVGWKMVAEEILRSKLRGDKMFWCELIWHCRCSGICSRPPSRSGQVSRCSHGCISQPFLLMIGWLWMLMNGYEWLCPAIFVSHSPHSWTQVKLIQRFSFLTDWTGANWFCQQTWHHDSHLVATWGSFLCKSPMHWSLRIRS